MSTRSVPEGLATEPSIERLIEWWQAQYPRAQLELVVGSRTWATGAWPAGIEAARAQRQRSLITARRATWREQLISCSADSLRTPCVASWTICAPVDSIDASRALGRALSELALPYELERDPWLALLCSSPSLEPVVQPLRRIAPTRLAVLLTGETGSGKEEFARILHRASGRPGAWVAENCAALPEALLESEMFGVRKGAYTGADQARRGRVVESDRGTLFLDEIGELPAAMQVKFLRVLQQRAVRPLGGEPIEVDLRVIAATHRDLPARIAQDLFRADLYFRLAGFVAHLPSLSQRREDLPHLVATLLQRIAEEGHGTGRSVSPAAFRRLQQLPLRGNVRELDNTLRRAAALAEGEWILPHHFPPDDSPPALAAAGNLEAHAVDQALTLASGVKADAARRLGWSRQKLYRRIKALGL
jgi:DNA-binding NtrC family response regulator